MSTVVEAVFVFDRRKVLFCPFDVGEEECEILAKPLPAETAEISGGNSQVQCFREESLLSPISLQICRLPADIRMPSQC
jgi:hypothetical protein